MIPDKAAELSLLVAFEKIVEQKKLCAEETQIFPKLPRSRLLTSA